MRHVSNVFIIILLYFFLSAVSLNEIELLQFEEVAGTIFI